MKPYAIRCCWRCKRTKVTLRRISKSDFACEQCEGWGNPEIENQSRIFYKEKNDKQK